MNTRLRLGALTTAVLASCSPAAYGARTPRSDAERLHAAVQTVTDVMVYDIMSPPQASRVYAYAGIAAYEAMRPGFPAYRSLAGQVNGLTPPPAPNGEVSYPLAGVHAYLAVGRTLTFSRARMDSLRTARDDEFHRTGMSDAVFARSVAYGDTVAKHVLAWAGKDHFLQTRGAPKFTVSQDPSRWVPTPPAYMDAVEPHWGDIRPFVMDSSSQFRPEPPFKFDTAKGSPYFREVMEVYDIRRTITDEQRGIAAFWDCNPYVMHVQGHTMFATKKISPGGHWMGIVKLAARQSNADIMRSADAYARTSMALADGFISGWAEKFHSNMIRPETVINRYVDEAWEPLLQTPPFPDYVSGHSLISAAAATVLTDAFGPNFAFVDSSEARYGLPARTFPSFAAAADEAALSRLYGGIHFRRSNEQGKVIGRQIGALIVERVHTHAGATVAQRR